MKDRSRVCDAKYVATDFPQARSIAKTHEMSDEPGARD